MAVVSTKMQDALNKQINAEMYSAYLYQSMAAYCETLGMKGFANWMNVQAKEEMSHAMKIYNYILERGGKIIFTAIDAPKTEWENLVDVFENVYEHEQYVTSLINNLLSLAIEEKDYATSNMLQWFVAEQVEEEANADELLQQLKLVGDKGSAVFMIDKELKTRVFVDETAAE